MVVTVNQNEKINYVEFPANDFDATKIFFKAVFDWSFIDYGPDYVAFSGAGLDGGFYQSDLSSLARNGSALIIFFSNNLEQTQSKIKSAGGEIIQSIFDFPGGRRFHFSDPNGNEFAVWSNEQVGDDRLIGMATTSK
jgi:predicted enzyme related to lactoylglutathione lyase